MEWDLIWYAEDNEAHLICWDSGHGQGIDITLTPDGGTFLSERDEQGNERLPKIDLASYLYELVKEANRATTPPDADATSGAGE